ncbi:MAG TPA: exonuclease SbcCD subunit D [bacterium]|nr:exonuclease SbcCD subunit D [bacterium]HQI49850.1 exonuclease SbcCD subunit D [bacterium]HQJ64587.1 exonuclease SbcCD subunit D [bacterium]
MRICQISDTHLGYSEYGKISVRSGLNQREQDFYDAWDQAIDRIIALQPDLVVHAGDLFHTPRPSNRAIRVALEGIHKISRTGIPMVLVSGNHETPRIRSTGSIFESLDLFPGIFSVYDGRYQRLSFGTLDVHAIPHCSLSEELEAACRSLEIREGAHDHILVTHGVWTQTGSYSMGEFNEQRLPDLTALYPGVFNHVALGHYHRRLDVAPNVSYCGATERTSLNQAGYSCGFLEVDLSSGERRYHELEVRNMIRLQPVDCRGIGLQELYDRVAELAGGVPAGAIAQLTLDGVEENLYLALEMRRLDDLFPDVFHLEKQLHVSAGEASAPAATLHFDTLSVEFGRYLSDQPEMALDREYLQQLGSRYLEEIEE